MPGYSSINRFKENLPACNELAKKKINCLIMLRLFHKLLIFTTVYRFSKLNVQSCNDGFHVIGFMMKRMIREVPYSMWVEHLSKTLSLPPFLRENILIFGNTFFVHMLHNFMNVLVQKPREGKNTGTHTLIRAHTHKMEMTIHYFFLDLLCVTVF